MIASALAFNSRVAILGDQAMHLGDAGGGGVLQAGRAALFPVFDQVGAQLTGPADAAFHEAEIKARVAPQQTAQENALGEGVIRCGEVVDMVVGEIADGAAIRPTGVPEPRFIVRRDTPQRCAHYLTDLCAGSSRASGRCVVVPMMRQKESMK